MSMDTNTGIRHRFSTYVPPKTKTRSKIVQKGFQNRGGKNVGILTLGAPWPPNWSQEPGMGPQDRFGPQNDLKIVSKWNLLDEKS